MLLKKPKTFMFFSSPKVRPKCIVSTEGFIPHLQSYFCNLKRLFFSFLLFSQSVANVDYNAVQSISILTPTCCENKTLSLYLHF